MLFPKLLFCVLTVATSPISENNEAKNVTDNCWDCFLLHKHEPCHTVPCKCDTDQIHREYLIPGSPLQVCPDMHIACVDKDRIALLWQVSSNVDYYYVEYRESSSKDRPRYTPLTRCGFADITHLQPSTQYAMRLHSVAVTDQIHPPRHSCIGQILESYTAQNEVPPLPVKTFSLLSWKSGDTGIAPLVAWERNEDMPCSYDILLYGENDEGSLREVLKTEARLPDSSLLPEVPFDTNYMVSIKALRDVHRDPLESEAVTLHIHAPSCYECFKENSSDHCAPETPSQLQADEETNESTLNSTFDIHLKWQQPRFPPDYYISRLITYNENVSSYEKHFTGEQTSFTFSNMYLTSEYEVLLSSYNKIGNSSPAIVHRRIKLRNPQNQVVEVEVFLIIVIPILLITLVLCKINGYLDSKLKRKRQHNFHKELQDQETPRTMSSVTSLSRQYDGWEIDISNLSINAILGEGAFGLVRKGLYAKSDTETIEVAVKMLKDHPSQDELRQFFHEIEIMKSVLPHPNLVSLIGCITNNEPLLVVEYCPRGDLQGYLRTAWSYLLNLNRRDFVVEDNPRYVTNKLYDVTDADMNDIPQPKDLLSYARQVILGMEYLSSLKLIHRDLAARNILMKDRQHVKISDFGLSREVNYHDMYCKLTGGKLPLRWMALESMTRQIYTTQSDVWAFGVLLWEIITMANTPYPGIPSRDILPLLKSGYRMEKPSNCSEKLYAIMLRCWQVLPSDRPTFTELRVMFEDFMEEVSCYLSLEPINKSDCVSIRYYNKAEVCG